MGANQITPTQFVKDNLPDYERRLEQARFDYGEAHCWELDPDTNFNFNWAMSMFVEALENFRQSVWQEACEVMRSQCQEILDDAYEYDRDDNGKLWQFEKLYRLNAMGAALIPEPPKNE